LFNKYSLPFADHDVINFETDQRIGDTLAIIKFFYAGKNAAENSNSRMKM